MSLSRNMNIIKDLWWAMPSGSDGYVTNENGDLPSLTVGLHNSIGYPAASGSYIEFHEASGDTSDKDVYYYFKTIADPIVPQSISVSCDAESGSTNGNMRLDLYINGCEIGSIGEFSKPGGGGGGGPGPSSFSGGDFSILAASGVGFTLTNDQRRAILDARIDGIYDTMYINPVHVGNGAIPTINGVANGKIYGLSISYENGNDDEYENFSANDNVTVSYHYPDSVWTTRESWNDNATATSISASSNSLISFPPSGVDAEDDYITCVTEAINMNDREATSGDNSCGYYRNYLVPSGQLNMNFNTGITQPVTRANLKMKLAFPPSGVNNKHNYYTVEGYNSNVASGVLLWGVGGYVGAVGFTEFDTELCWLDPTLSSNIARSGDVSSTNLQNQPLFDDINFKIRGMPSGVQLAAAELRVESEIGLPLYIKGASAAVSLCDITREPSGFSSDINNRMRGNWLPPSGNAQSFSTASVIFNELSGSGVHITYNGVQYSGFYKDCNTGLGSTPEWFQYYYNHPTDIESETYTRALRMENKQLFNSYNLDNYVDFGRIILPESYSILLHVSTSGNQAWSDKNWNLLQIGDSNDPHLSIESDGFGWNSIKVRAWNDSGSKRGTYTDLLDPHDAFLIYSYDNDNNTAVLYSYDKDTDIINSGVLTSFNAIRNSGSFLLGIPSGYAFGTANNFKGQYHEIRIENSFMDLVNVRSFIDSRFTNISSYMQTESPDISYARWDIPTGSGNQSHNGIYGLQDISIVAPGFEQIEGVSFEVDLEHTTDHPSGVWIKPTLKVIKNSSTFTSFLGEKLIGTTTGIETHTITPYTTNPTVYDTDWDDDVFDLETSYDGSGSDVYYGDLKIHAVRIIAESVCVFQEDNDNVNLYVKGIDMASSGDMPLYIYSLPSGSMPLFIHGITSINDNIPLHTIGLNINPWTASRNKMNLVTEGLVVPEGSGTKDLYIRGSTTDHGFNTVSLYIEQNFDPDNMLPLYINSTDQGTESATMNLFLGTEFDIDNNISLFVMNEVSGVSPSGLNLYMDASDSYELTNDMNLFMARDTEGVKSSMTLHILAPSGSSEDLPLYVFGVSGSNENITMYVKGEHNPNDNINLFTHGF